MAGPSLPRLALLLALVGLFGAERVAAQPVSAAAIALHPEGLVRIIARPVREGRTEIRWQRYDAEGRRVGEDRLLRRTSGHIGVLRAARLADGRTAVGWASRTEWQTNVYAVLFTDDRGRRARRPISLGVFRAPASPVDLVLIPQSGGLVVRHFGQRAPCQEDGGEGSACPELVVSTIDEEGALTSARGIGWPNGARIGPAIRSEAGHVYLSAEVTLAGASALREAGAPERCALPDCYLGVTPVEGAALAFADGLLALVARVGGSRYVGAWSSGSERLPSEEGSESDGSRALARLDAASASCTPSGLSLVLRVGERELTLASGEGATIPWHAFLDGLEGASDSRWTGSALVTLKANGRLAAFVCVDGEIALRTPSPRER